MTRPESIRAFGLAAILAATMAMAQPALAAPGGTQSAMGVAVAEIVAPLTVSPIDDLDFGGIALQSSGAGSVTLDPASGLASYDGVSQISCGTGTCAPHLALFAIKGIAGRNYRVVLPDNATASPVENNGTPLAVNAINSSSANLPGTSNRGLLDDNGDDRLMVGGRLDVPAGTAPGHYVAQLTLVVSYD